MSRSQPNPRLACRLIDKLTPSSFVPLDWAALLLQVFAIDVLECPKCMGRMKILAFITKPDVVRRILEHLDLPIAPPSSSRGPPALRAVG